MLHCSPKGGTVHYELRSKRCLPRPMYSLMGSYFRDQVGKASCSIVHNTITCLTRQHDERPFCFSTLLSRSHTVAAGTCTIRRGLLSNLVSSDRYAGRSGLLPGRCRRPDCSGLDHGRTATPRSTLTDWPRLLRARGI